jgi:hypothetical protein
MALSVRRAERLPAGDDGWEINPDHNSRKCRSDFNFLSFPNFRSSWTRRKKRGMNAYAVPGPSQPKKLGHQPDLYRRKSKNDRHEPSAEELKKYTKSAYTKVRCISTFRGRDENNKLAGPQKNVPNKKLAGHLNRLSELHKRAAVEAYEHDQLLLPQDSTGLLEPENELERTWKIGQDEIKANVGSAAAAKGFELKLDQFGPYVCDYTGNGR